MQYRVIETFLGPVWLAGSSEGLQHIEFGTPSPGADWVEEGLDDAVTQLTEWFAGTRQRFDLELAPRGTAFQREVWDALTRIPYGTTTSYGAIAAQVGRPTASRAVGAANGCNPLPVVVPCHRVVGASGALTGFRGGIELKRALLRHEGALLL